MHLNDIVTGTSSDIIFAYNGNPDPRLSEVDIINGNTIITIHPDGLFTVRDLINFGLFVDQIIDRSLNKGLIMGTIQNVKCIFTGPDIQEIIVTYQNTKVIHLKGEYDVSAFLYFLQEIRQQNAIFREYEETLQKSYNDCKSCEEQWEKETHKHRDCMPKDKCNECDNDFLFTEAIITLAGLHAYYPEHPAIDIEHYLQQWAR